MYLCCTCSAIDTPCCTTQYFCLSLSHTYLPTCLCMYDCIFCSVTCTPNLNIDAFDLQGQEVLLSRRRWSTKHSSCLPNGLQAMCRDRWVRCMRARRAYFFHFEHKASNAFWPGNCLPALASHGELPCSNAPVVSLLKISLGNSGKCVSHARPFCTQRSDRHPLYLPGCLLLDEHPLRALLCGCLPQMYILLRATVPVRVLLFRFYATACSAFTTLERYVLFCVLPCTCLCIMFAYMHTPVLMATLRQRNAQLR